MNNEIEDKIKYIRITINEENAIKIFNSLSDEEKEIILKDTTIQNFILNFYNTDVIRNIFRKSPIFFQEILFENERIQNILLEYTTNNSKEIRNMQVFIHNIKSPKVLNQLIYNKKFMLFITNCNYNSIKKSFFKNLDTNKLFYNIVNNDIYSKMNKGDKISFITLFNIVSNHLLLPYDYEKTFSSSADIIKLKKISSFDKIYIDDNTLSILSSKMIDELIKLDNIDKQKIIKYICGNLNLSIKKLNYNFKKIFYHLQNNSSEFTDIDLIYFQNIIINSKKDSLLKEKFIDFLYNILCNSKNNDEYIKSMLYITITNYDIDKDTFIKLFKNPNIIKTLVFIKFKNIPTIENQLDLITKEQMLKINAKSVNMIVKKIDTSLIKKDIDEYILGIKMYLIFGLELSLKILDNYYGNIDELFYINLEKTNTSNITFLKEGKKYIPNINKEFINFMFSNCITNNFKNMLIEKNYLNENWSYLYNNFKKVKEKCRNNLSIKLINIILKQTSPNRSITDISPNNYKLGENDILEDVCVGNRSEKKPSEIYSILLEIYEKMKLRTESSIPYVKGYYSNGYKYETMKLNDPVAFTLGFKANSCIRIEDIAHNHLLHATLCRNGRIILIYDHLNRLVAFSPIKRNGEVLIVNSIECTFDYNNDYILKTFNKCIDHIVEVTHNTIEDTTPINLVCIGKDSHLKPNYKNIPPRVNTPTIYEKNDPIYRNTDEYHKNLVIIKQTDDLYIYKIKYGNPVVSYKDPRNIIRHCNFLTDKEELINKCLKIIDYVRYTNYDIAYIEQFNKTKKELISKCIYNDDWYVLIDTNGNIYGEYINTDNRACDEYIVTLNELCIELNKENTKIKTYTI